MCNNPHPPTHTRNQGLLERIFSEPARGPYGWRHQPQQSEDPHQGQRPMALGPAGSRDLGRGQTSNAMSNEMSQLLGLWVSRGAGREWGKGTAVAVLVNWAMVRLVISMDMYFPVSSRPASG